MDELEANGAATGSAAFWHVSARRPDLALAMHGSASSEAEAASGTTAGAPANCGSSNNGSNGSKGNGGGSFSGGGGRSALRPLVPRLPYTRALRHELSASLRQWLQALGALGRLNIPPAPPPGTVQPRSFWSGGHLAGAVGASSLDASSSLAPLLDLEPALRDGSLLCALAEALAQGAAPAADRPSHGDSSNYGGSWFASATPEPAAAAARRARGELGGSSSGDGPMLAALRGWDAKPVPV